LAHAGAPQPWQISFQPPATPLMEMVERFSDGLLVVVALITAFVLALLVYVMVKFNAQANPIPSRTTHNTLIEVSVDGGADPHPGRHCGALVLVAVRGPRSRPRHSGYDPAKDRTITIKATGNQWYWSYEYPDSGGVSLIPTCSEDGERKPGDPRLLAVDNQLVVPVGVGRPDAGDRRQVIHALCRPLVRDQGRCGSGPAERRLGSGSTARGSTMVSARSCAARRRAATPTTCTAHAYMPIAVHAVSPAAFDTWAKRATTDLKGAYQALAAATPGGAVAPATGTVAPAAPAR
jgi:cytochrome c oxidase subunit 2